MKLKDKISFLFFIISFSLNINAQVDTTANATSTETENYPPDTVFSTVTNGFNTADEPRLNLNGYVQTDDRLKFDGWKLNRQEYLLDVKLEYKPIEKSRVFAEIWLRSYRFPDVANLQSLSDKKRILNFDADLREAYVDIYGLFTKNLDMRIGRQRIAWGTGDKLNPTDNLNPVDMEDVWDFGRHLGSNALQLNYYAGTFTFTGVAIPWFTPSVLPGTDWTPAFMPNFKIPEVIYDTSFISGVTIPVYITNSTINDTLVLPQRTLKHYPSFGLKIKKSLGNFDVSLSYVYGRDPLPLPTELHTILTVDTFTFIPQIKAEARMDIHTRLEYPVMKVVGFDFAGSLWNIGLRGEAACFFPVKNYMKRYLHYSVPDLGITKDSVMTDSLVLDNKPYVKFVLGLDYMFKHGFYLNAQYLHGFLHERGPKELNDYFLVSLEWSTLRDKLKLRLLNGGIQIADFKDITNNHAWFYLPEISYKPFDNAEFTIGAHLLDGKNTTAFGKVSKNDDIYLKFRYSF